MTRITLDSQLSRTLGEMDRLVELCDEQGKLLGYFVAEDPNPGQPPPGFESSLSAEEVERRRGTRTGRTTDEILREAGLA